MYINQGRKQQDIADELTAKGFRVSKGAVHRTIKNHAARLKELRDKQDWAQTLIAATNKTPRLDIADAGLQIAAMKLLEEVSGIGNFEDMDTEKKISLLTKVSRAIGLAANVELNFERGRKQGILDAEKKLEETAGELGIDDKMAIIRAKLLGLNK
jgi:transcriptional regulator with XRE-family HTH domain